MHFLVGCLRRAVWCPPWEPLWLIQRGLRSPFVGFPWLLKDYCLLAIPGGEETSLPTWMNRTLFWGLWVPTSLAKSLLYWKHLDFTSLHREESLFLQQESEPWRQWFKQMGGVVCGYFDSMMYVIDFFQRELTYLPTCKTFACEVIFVMLTYVFSQYFSYFFPPT